MLGARIDAHERCRQEAQDRTDVDDLTAALMPHAGEHGLDHAQDAEDVGVEQRLRLADARFLDGPDQIDTGIVDKNVDSASAAAHHFNAALDRSPISDIKRHELDARERSCRCRCADAAEDTVAPAGQQLGGRPADAGRSTRDQDNAALSLRHRSLLAAAAGQWASVKLDSKRCSRSSFGGTIVCSLRMHPCRIHRSTSATLARKSWKAPGDSSTEMATPACLLRRS